MFPDMSGFVTVFKIGLVAIAIVIPLGIYELVRIGMWLAEHVSVAWS